MESKVFISGINLITQTFGEAPIKGGRLEKIKSFCVDRVDGEGFVQICEDICATFRNYPLPIDFQKAVQDWNKNFYLKKGYYYNASEKQNKNEEIGCSICFSTGIVKVINIHDEKQKHLIRCGCEDGLNNKAIMPHWDFQLKNIYNLEPLDSKWFNPNIDEKNSEEISITKIMKKVEAWKRQIRLSENYWISLGYTKNSNLK